MTAELAVIRSPAEEAIIHRYPAIRAREGWGGAAVVRLRDAAYESLKARGLPNRRVEEWKYTDLRALMRDLPERAEAPSARVREADPAPTSSVALPAATRILFLNGHLAGTPRLDGVDLARLSDSPDLAASVGVSLARERSYGDNALVALNSVFMDDCLVLRVPAGTTPGQPIHLAFRDHAEQAFSSFPRVLVVVEPGASATVIETHEGRDGIAYQTFGLVEIEVGDGARVEHVRVNAAGDRALAFSTLGVRIGAEADFSTLTVTTGAAVSRHQVFATFAGERAKASIRGAVLLRAKQHADSTLVVDHAAAHGVSREEFRIVLDDESRGVFQGKIIVQPGAQKTDGKMAAHTLLLSDEAEINAKPELEIFADDVVCGHGATAGALDDDLLFYLRARGIPAKEAEALMIQAFVGETLEPVTDDTLREQLTAMVEAWLKARA